MIERFARPYADALFATAGSVDEVRGVRAELGRFADALENVPALRQMIANPGIPREAKQATLREVSGQLGLGNLAGKFLDTLLSNQRLQSLPVVIGAIDELIHRKSGVQRALITSATDLSSDQQSRLRELLESSLGGRIKLEIRIDESLLGGFVAQVGSERYDVSLKGELERMASHLAGSAQEAATA
ncbi:MAG: ATP synthase F1 subunit delta [Acidobacteriota bacterium]